jgi:hypothetical protein
VNSVTIIENGSDEIEGGDQPDKEDEEQNMTQWTQTGFGEGEG